MNRRVIKSYTTKYNKPIILNKGDVVTLGEEEKKKEWLGWIWATSGKISGWIPKQIVDTEDNKIGTISEYFSAKELNVSEGESVFAIRELNGWCWVRSSETGEEGWVPAGNLDL